jgi:alkylhydroperoxidase family enzyme
MRVFAVRAFLFSVFVSAHPFAAAQPEKSPPQRPFPSVDNDAAWARLPRDNPPLPHWARVLAGPLPKATARMLELDHLQRARNPLGSELAGRIQWEVADSLGSKLGKATAEADLRRANHLGLLDKPGDRTGLAPEVRVALAFARKLTLEGFAITDEEFATLLRLYGPEKVTAIVHTVAYANFHNRILLGLGIEGDPVPPPDVHFTPEQLAKLSTPARPSWGDLKAVSAEGISLRPDWNKTTAEELHLTLEKQKERPLRIPLPDAARLAALPPKEKEGAARIMWNTISSGYQPEMPRAWFLAMNAFYEEAKADRLFTNSVFWVVTRTNDCFY